MKRKEKFAEQQKKEKWSEINSFKFTYVPVVCKLV